MPTPITARREQARSVPSNSRLRQPARATGAPGAARRQAARLSVPSSSRTAIEVQAPNGASQGGASQAWAVVMAVADGEPHAGAARQRRTRLGVAAGHRVDRGQVVGVDAMAHAQHQRDEREAENGRERGDGFHGVGRL